MMKPDELGVEYAYEDRGNSRFYYKPIDKKDKRLLCTQPNHKGIDEWWLCSKDGEPSRHPEFSPVVIMRPTR